MNLKKTRLSIYLTIYITIIGLIIISLSLNVKTAELNQKTNTLIKKNKKLETTNNQLEEEIQTKKNIKHLEILAQKHHLSSPKKIIFLSKK